MIGLLSRIIMYLMMKEEEEKSLGHIAAKYESGDGTSDAGTISNTKGDPGGKSYGTYQLSIAAGTLKRYVEQSEFKDYFRGIPFGSKDFDYQWMTIADMDEQEFRADQHDFIKRTHFLPANRYAKNQGFSVNVNAVAEAIFSISVQHGGYKRVINLARRLKEGKDPEAQVKALYKARRQYVNSLKSLSPYIKRAIMNRYDREEGEVLGLLQ